MIGKGSIKLGDKISLQWVPSVINWNNNMYFYGYHNNNAIQIKTDQELNLLNTITLPIGFNKEFTQKIYPAIQPPGQDGQEHLHVFYPLSLSDSPKKIITACVVDQKKVSRIGGATPFTFEGNFGLTSHQDGIIITAYNYTQREITFYLVGWANLYSSSGVTTQTLKIPEEYSSLKLQGIDATCLWIPPNKKSNEMELHLVLGFAYKTDTENGLLFGECKVVTTGGSSSYIDMASFTWKKIPQNSPYQGLYTFRPSLHLGDDGRVYAMTFTYDSSTTFEVDTCFGDMGINTTDIDLASIKSFQLWMRDKDQNWISLPNPLAEAGISPQDKVIVGTIGYIHGQMYETASEQNSELIDKFLPLRRTFFWISLLNRHELHYWGKDFGKLCRVGLTEQVGQKKILLGVIEGPPPVPNENLNIEEDDNPRVDGSTVYSKSESGRFGFDLKLSAAVVAKLKGEGGFIGKAKVEASLKAGYKFAYSSEVGQTSTVEYIVKAEEMQKNGKHIVKPYGTVVFLGANWTGYAYQYVDENGKIPDNAPTYNQIFPSKITVSTDTYIMNPKTKPYPGDLESYVATKEKIKELEDNADMLVNAGGVTNKHLTTTWSLNSKTVTSFESYFQNSFTHGLFLELEALIGAGWNDWFFSKGEFMLGAAFKLDTDFSYGGTTKLGLQTHITTRGNVKTPGTYNKFVYYTYQLKPNEKWAKELKDNLVKENWPEDEYEKKLNQRIKDTIEPGSKPWKITYVVDERHKN